MQLYLKWLAKSRRKTGINFSKAVSQDMPAGTGRKGEKPPRKRKRAQEPPKVVLTRAGSASNIVQPVALMQVHLSSHPVGIQNMADIANPVFSDISGQTTPQQADSSQLMPTSNVGNLLSGGSATPSFPRPQHGQILIYLLPFCPPQTSVCWGCGNSLKPNGMICPPPLDLVLVSNMMREWVHEGRLCNKVGNVYFHCNLQCVRRRQPYINPQTFVITPEIRHFLLPTHRNYLAQSVGVLV